MGLARRVQYVEATSSKNGCTVRKKLRGVPITATLGGQPALRGDDSPHGWGMASPAHPTTYGGSPSNLKLKRSQPDNGVDEVTLAPSRVFCPVPGCLHGDVANSRGWATVQTMRNHLEGTPPWPIPRERFHKIGFCLIALRLVAIAIGWCREVQGRCTDLAGLRLVQRGAPSLGLSVSSSQRAVNLEAVLAADRPDHQAHPCQVQGSLVRCSDQGTVISGSCYLVQQWL